MFAKIQRHKLQAANRNKNQRQKIKIISLQNINRGILWG